ncbi:MAG: PEP-CTERM system TPR-repeat protein PrsT [Colwellia sp.]|nr:PEP-CTERM system TPR-repeat protein PrsT [Colwellia sp.]
MKINNKLTLAVSLAISLTACSPSMTIDEYIAQAKASLIADNSGRTALVSLKNAAKIDPKNSEVRFLLGEVFLGMGDYPTAEKEFEKSVEYGSVRKFLYSNLLEAKVRQHKFDEVEELVNYAKDSSEEEYNKVLTYAGISALYQNDVKLATFYIAKANELGEDYIYSIIGKSYLSNTKEEISRSLELINTITQNKPKQVDAWLAKAFLLQGQRKAKEAAESFEQYSVLRPKDVSVLFFIAQNYLTAGESDKAAIIINKLIEPFKNNSFINQMKGQLEFDNKNYKLAQQFAEKAYQLNPELISSTIISGMSSYHLEEFERAYRSLSKAQVYVSSTHLIHKLIAELQLRLGYDDDAYVTLEELVNQGNINEDFLVSASQELIRSGKASAAQKLLQASIEITPANAKVLREQGLIKLSINEVAAGIEILEKSLALDPSNQETEESLASAYLNTGQLDKAQKIANTWQESADKKVQGLILESAILDNQAKPEEAALMLKKALMLDSNSIAALLKLGVYAHKNNNIDQAFEYFKRGLVVSPQQPAVIKSLITLAYNNAELTKQLDTFLLEQVKIRPQSDELKLAQAYLYASQSKFEGAISLLNEIKGSKPPVSNINLLIGDYYSRLKNWKAAITSYQAAILFDASDYRAVTNLIRVYEHVNDIKLALDVVNKARLKTPNHYGLLLVQVNYQSRLGRTPKFTAIEQLKNHTQTKSIGCCLIL